MHVLYTSENTTSANMNIFGHGAGFQKVIAPIFHSVVMCFVLKILSIIYLFCCYDAWVQAFGCRLKWFKNDNKH